MPKADAIHEYINTHEELKGRLSPAHTAPTKDGYTYEDDTDWEAVAMQKWAELFVC